MNEMKCIIFSIILCLLQKSDNKSVLSGDLLGKIGITVIIEWEEPKDATHPDDVAAAERALQLTAGWFCNAIFVNGDYPDILKAQVAKFAKTSGLDRSPLPEFSEDEKRYNRGRLLSYHSM